MPATIINVNAVEESTAKAILQMQSQEDALNNIDRVINSMEGVWESEAQKVYTDKFREAKAKVQKFNTSVNDSLKNMRNFVSECVLVDEQTARELRNVSW